MPSSSFDELHSDPLRQSLPLVRRHRKIEELLSVSEEFALAVFDAVRAEIVPQVIEPIDTDKGRLEGRKLDEGSDEFVTEIKDLPLHGDSNPPEPLCRARPPSHRPLGLTVRC